MHNNDSPLCFPIRVRALLRAGLLSCLLAASPIHAAPAASLPPIDHFFQHAAFSSALLSPSGKYVAMRMADDAGRDGLAVIATDNHELHWVAHFNNVDVGDFSWVNDQRLVYNSVDSKVAPGDRRRGAGLFAVDRDGNHFRMLADMGYQPASTTGTMIKRNVLPWNTFLLDQPGGQHGNQIYVQRPGWNSANGDLDRWDLLLLDTTNGSVSTVPRPGLVQDWLLDQQGVPRLAVTEQEGRNAVYYLDPATEAWRRVAEFAAYGEAPGSFIPLGFGPAGQLYVRARNGQDMSALYQFDLASGKLGAEPLVSLHGFDFSGELVYGRGKLLGMQVLTDARAMVWFDADMKAIQQRIDAQLPATTNLVSAPHDAGSPWLLVRAYADTRPEVTLLYNSSTGVLQTLGQSRPEIVPAQMGEQQLMHYPARDGLPIPAWLTLPPGGQRQHLPMVVLVHGGPFVRGNEWGWDGEAQFLASRGYAVLQPEFRGSTGFGAHHFTAGWKQWGLKMQDDIADGTRWAIAQGYADPKRICIAGASYGGYAALMGLVNAPELYRCAVDWAGVTDIGKMYSATHGVLSDQLDEWRNYGMPVLVGDPVKDAAQFQATSPLAQAARIKQPLLLAYGSSDRRVPLYQGQDFYNAVKAGNQQVEWVLYDGEGHGWTLAKNRIDFWGRVERFLARHIGQQ